MFIPCFWGGIWLTLHHSVISDDAEKQKKTDYSSRIGFAVIREFLGVYLLVLKSERDRGIHNLQYTVLNSLKVFFFFAPLG